MPVTATLFNTLPSVQDWSAQASNGSLTVALARGPTSAYATTIDNGTSWTARTMPSSQDWTAIAWNGAVFVAVAQGVATCWTSSDGIVWTARAMPAALTWIDITWDGTSFCAIAQGTNQCATSVNGTTWTARTMPSAQAWWKITANASAIVAVALNTASAARSTDHGVTWSGITLPGSLGPWELIHSGSLFYAICVDAVYTSSNSGATWSALAGVNLPLDMRAAVMQLNPSVILAVADDGSYRLSADAGAQWAAGPSLFAIEATAFTSVGRAFYAIEPGGTHYIKIDVSSVLGTGTASVPLAVRVVQSGISQITVRVSIVPSALLSGAQSVCIGVGIAAVWTASVTIDGLDTTDQVIGDIRVDAAEGAARIAEFAIRPDNGAEFDLAGWTGLSVTIDVADFSTGAPRYAMRLFTGVIDSPTLDMAAKTIALRCTDDLQGRCEAMSNAALDALIGGYASTSVFDKAASGWKFAQDRLSTVTASLDISPEGNMRVTGWQAKPIPDMTFGASIIGDNSLAPSIAGRSGLVNEVLVSFDYRFPRVKSEGYPVSYTYVTLSNFAAHILAGNWWLQRQQVPAAIRAAGGTVESITYDPLPNYIIPVGSGFFTPSAADADLCMGFAAGVSFSYAQTITEQHRIFVRNQKSIDRIGLLQTTIAGSLEGAYPDKTAVETGIKQFRDKASSIPPLDAAPVNMEKTTSIDTTLTPETDRAAANAAMEALIAVAKVKIWASHRQNRIAATVPLIPALDIDKTVEINANGIAARGKVARVTHRLSPAGGAAITDFEIALCAVAGYGISHASDPTTAPAGTAAGQTPIAATASAAFHFGNAEDHQLVISFPGVEENERANASPTINTVIAAPLVEDLFTVTL